MFTLPVIDSAGSPQIKRETVQKKLGAIMMLHWHVGETVGSHSNY